MIEELVRAYSEYMCPPEDYIDDNERKIDMEIYQDDARSVLEWLVKIGYELDTTK